MAIQKLPLFSDVPWALGTGFVLELYQWTLGNPQPVVPGILASCVFLYGLTNNPKKKLLGWGMRAKLICRYKLNYLEYSWKLFWLRKGAVIGSSLGTMTSSDMNSWLSALWSMSSIDQGLSPFTKLVVVRWRCCYWTLELLVMLVIVVVNRFYTWGRLLIAFLYWQLA